MKVTWSEFEIHQIVYLSSRGWTPNTFSPSRGRWGWAFESKQNPEDDIWYSDIDDAYKEQRLRDGFVDRGSEEDARYRNS